MDIGVNLIDINLNLKTQQWDTKGAQAKKLLAAEMDYWRRSARIRKQKKKNQQK